MPREILLIGYGNELRGDDAVGPQIAAVVSAWDLPQVNVRAVPQLTPELAETIAAARQVIFVDASADPTIRAVEIQLLESSPIRSSTLGHMSRPEEVLTWAKVAFEYCPPALLVKIPAENFNFQSGLSPLTQREMIRALALLKRLLTAN